MFRKNNSKKKKKRKPDEALFWKSKCSFDEPFVIRTVKTVKILSDLDDSYSLFADQVIYF